MPRSPRASDIHFPSPSLASSSIHDSGSAGSTSVVSVSVSPSSSRGSQADSIEASSADHDSSTWLSPSAAGSSFRGLSPSTTRENPYSGTNNDETSFVVLVVFLSSSSISFSTLCYCINLIQSRLNSTSTDQDGRPGSFRRVVTRNERNFGEDSQDNSEIEVQMVRDPSVGKDDHQGGNDENYIPSPWDPYITKHLKRRIVRERGAGREIATPSCVIQ